MSQAKQKKNAKSARAATEESRPKRVTYKD